MIFRRRSPLCSFGERHSSIFPFFSLFSPILICPRCTKPKLFWRLLHNNQLAPKFLAVRSKHMNHSTSSSMRLWRKPYTMKDDYDCIKALLLSFSPLYCCHLYFVFLFLVPSLLRSGRNSSFFHSTSAPASSFLASLFLCIRTLRFDCI